MSSVKTTVDTKQFERDIKRLKSTASGIAEEAIRASINQAKAFYMQFDETEAVPYTRNTDGTITVSGPGLVDASDGSVEEVLQIATQVAFTTLKDVVNNGLKEAVK